MTILHRSRQLSDHLYRCFDDKPFPSAERQFMAAGSFDAVHEHHRAICLLVSEGMCGSAFCLLRPMFDGCIRGLWLLHIADEQKLAQFAQGHFDFQPSDVLKAIETQNLAGAERLQQVYDESFKAMSSYVHGGFHQVVGRLGSGFVGPNYHQDEVDALLENANWFALLAALKAAEQSSSEQLQKEVIEIGEWYGVRRI